MNVRKSIATTIDATEALVLVDWHEIQAERNGQTKQYEVAIYHRDRANHLRKLRGEK